MNLELAKKPAVCLEYILVHEMVHLLERRHAYWSTLCSTGLIEGAGIGIFHNLREVDALDARDSLYHACPLKNVDLVKYYPYEQLNL